MYCRMLSCVREIPRLFSQEGLGSLLRRPFGLSRDKVYLTRSTQWQGRYRNCGARGMGRLKMPLIYRIHLRKVPHINEIDTYRPARLNGNIDELASSLNGT